MFSLYARLSWGLMYTGCISITATLMALIVTCAPVVVLTGFTVVFTLFLLYGLSLGSWWIFSLSLSLSELLLRENQSCLTDSAHTSSVLFAIFESLRETVSRGWGQWWNILLHDEILLHYASKDSRWTVDHLEPSSLFRQRWLSLWACWWRSPSWRGCWSPSSLSSGGAWDSWLCTDTFPRLWGGSSVSSAPLLSLLGWPRWESVKLAHSLRALSRVRLFPTPRTVAHQAPLSMGFSRQEF